MSADDEGLFTPEVPPKLYQFHRLVKPPKTSSSEAGASKVKTDKTTASQPISLSTLLESGRTRQWVKNSIMDPPSEIHGIITEVERHPNNSKFRAFTSTFDTPTIEGKLLPEKDKGIFRTNATIQVTTDDFENGSNLPCGQATLHLTEVPTTELDDPLNYRYYTHGYLKPEFRLAAFTNHQNDNLVTMTDGSLMIRFIKGKLTWDGDSQEDVPCRILITKHDPQRVETQV